MATFWDGTTWRRPKEAIVVRHEHQESVADQDAKHLDNRLKDQGVDLESKVRQENYSKDYRRHHLEAQEAVGERAEKELEERLQQQGSTLQDKVRQENYAKDYRRHHLEAQEAVGERAEKELEERLKEQGEDLQGKVRQENYAKDYRRHHLEAQEAVGERAEKELQDRLQNQGATLQDKVRQENYSKDYRRHHLESQMNIDPEQEKVELENRMRQKFAINPSGEGRMTSYSGSGSIPYSTLILRPVPTGVDDSKLEAYLSDSEFQNVFKMSRSEFASQPDWKKTNLKRAAKLF